MPTTPRGFTYPDAAGHTRLWEHLQTLAEDVDTELDDVMDDTGWVAITTGFQSPWQVASGAPPYYRVRAGVVYFAGAIQRPSGYVGGFVNAVQLPALLAPAMTVTAAGGGGTGVVQTFQITSTAMLQAYQESSTSGYLYLAGMTYPLGP